MRLAVVERRHSLTQKLLLQLGWLIHASEPLDVMKVFMYRPEFFGKPFCDLAHVVLRGPSDWSVAERELFGAFTSKLNHCVF
jgi:hypothetical protein